MKSVNFSLHIVEGLVQLSTLLYDKRKKFFEDRTTAREHLQEVIHSFFARKAVNFENEALRSLWLC